MTTDQETSGTRPTSGPAPSRGCGLEGSDPPAIPKTPGTSQHEQAGILMEMIRELRGQRESFHEAQKLAAVERRSEHRWRMAFQSLVFGLPVLLGGIYFLFFLNSAGFRWGPWGEVVGIVRIEGSIDAAERASADSVVPLLTRAFSNPSVKAVVLSIDSPGGAPVEAERIYTAIDSLKRRHPKPVVAVINNVGASAAFLIALHADSIVAGRYSLVGSIGAIISPWQLDRAIARYDVSQRVYASGKLKSFLNPFTPVTPEVDTKAQELVDQLGASFLDEVKARRGTRLKSGIDVATGEVWAGPEAKEIGLVDDIGTLDEYVADTWGLGTYDFGPSAQGLQLLGRTVQDFIASSIRRLLSTSVAVN